MGMKKSLFFYKTDGWHMAHTMVIVNRASAKIATMEVFLKYCLLDFQALKYNKQVIIRIKNIFSVSKSDIEI